MIEERGGRKVIESGTNNGWRYNKYSDGTYESWYNNYYYTQNPINTATGNVFRSPPMSLTYPSFATFSNIKCVQVLASHAAAFSWQSAWPEPSGLSFVLFAPSQVASSNIRVSAYLYGDTPTS